MPPIEEYAQLLHDAMEQAESDIIPFVVAVGIIGVLLIGAVVMLYRVIRKANKEQKQAEHEAAKERLEMYMDREQQILAVVKSNTDAMTRNTEVAISLKSLVERDNESLKAVLKQGLDRIHDRLDEAQSTLAERGIADVKTQAALDEIKRGIMEIRRERA